MRRPGDQYLPASLVDKYNNTYHFSIGNKLINAAYSPLSVKKIFAIVSVLQNNPGTYKNKDLKKRNNKKFSSKKSFVE